MKTTVQKIAAAYAVLSLLKVNELDKKDKIALVKISNKMKSVANDLDEFRNEAMKRISPEGFDEIAYKVQAKANITPAEMLTFVKVDKDLADCMKEEQEKEIELDIKPLKDSVLEKLIDSNPDLTVGQAEIIYDFLT